MVQSIYYNVLIFQCIKIYPIKDFFLWYTRPSHLAITFYHKRFSRVMKSNPKLFNCLSGKELVISNNVLDVATAVDIAQFEHVTVRCNRKLISATSLVQSEENCPNTLNVPLLPKLNIFSDFEEREAEITYTNSPPATLGKTSISFN